MAGDDGTGTERRFTEGRGEHCSWLTSAGLNVPLTGGGGIVFLEPTTAETTLGVPREFARNSRGGAAGPLLGFVSGAYREQSDIETHFLSRR